jgi:uncharacterized membrane protein
MDAIHVLSRLFHIISAILWAGGAFVTFLFLEPAGMKLRPVSATDARTGREGTA